MDAPVSLADLAALMAAPARARMLETLLEGEPLSAIELAVIGDVQPPTASSHLSKLVGAGLVTSKKQGRHRFFEAASAHVTDVVEGLNELIPDRAQPKSRAPKDLQMVRTCYDHLAGKLGTSLTDAMTANRYLSPQGKDFDLTAEGKTFFSDLGVDVEAAQRQRRLFARRCLDWTERRYHLGGALGAAFMVHCFDTGWIRHGDRKRGVRVTPHGSSLFRVYFRLIVGYPESE